MTDRDQVFFLSVAAGLAVFVGILWFAVIGPWRSRNRLDPLGRKSYAWRLVLLVPASIVISIEINGLTRMIQGLMSLDSLRGNAADLSSPFAVLLVFWLLGLWVCRKYNQALLARLRDAGWNFAWFWAVPAMALAGSALTVSLIEAGYGWPGLAAGVLVGQAVPLRLVFVPTRPQ